MPKIRPQNAADKPNSDMPEAVIRKVTSAASRSLVTAIAPVSAPAMAANSASPANAAISSLGNAENSETNVAPKMPSTR
ncbi:hypothetical protein D3C81_2147690 [compost metagenome]